MRARVVRWWAAVRRGLGHAGPERETMWLIVKSALAASGAWVLANDVLGAPSATFAPFSALLMVQVTISQSLAQSLRFAGAVLFGVALTGLLVPVMGPTVAAFAVLMLAGLVIGRWRKLGSQGSQVAVAALFAFASFSQPSSTTSSLVQLGSIAGMVVLGCVLGVVVNLVIAPPMRFRSGAHVVESLSKSVCDLLCDISETLAQGTPEQDRVGEWSSRAGRMPELAESARSVIEHAAESMRFNPRRLWMRQSSDFRGYRYTLDAFERASEQLTSMCRSLRHSKAEDRSTTEAEHEFARGLADVLAAAAEASRILGEIHSVADREHVSELDDPIEQGRKAVERLSRHADDHDLDQGYDGPIYTGLLTDARRLVEEYGEARSRLAHETTSAS
jgi:uncharacterized membrane protein YgaE (UPF0421/DUF939 family)